MDVLEFINTFNGFENKCTEIGRKKLSLYPVDSLCNWHGTPCDTQNPDDPDEDNCDADGCYGE